MPTVQVSFTPLPAHVRTARLVATAVARRAGVPEQFLDEVRLAVGEACSRAVGLHQRHAPDEPVLVELTDEQGRFSVVVHDHGPLGSDLLPDDLSPLETDLIDPPAGGATEGPPEVLPPGFGLAVISGLVDNVDVQQDAGGTRVRMSWPAEDPMAPRVGR